MNKSDVLERIERRIRACERVCDDPDYAKYIRQRAIGAKEELRRLKWEIEVVGTKKDKGEYVT